MLTRYLPHVLSLSTAVLIGKFVLCPNVLIAFTPKEPISASMLQGESILIGCGKGPPRIYMGSMVGVVFARHTDATASTRFSGLQANGNTATGTGWNIGWQIWYILGDVKASKHSLAVTVQYASMPGEVESTVSTPLAFGEPNATRAQAKYEKEIDYAAVSMDMLYNYWMGSRFCLMAGPSLGIVVRSEQRERLSLLGDNSSVGFAANEESRRQGVQLENGNHVAVSSSDIPERNALMLSLKGGISYELSMGKKILVPYVLYEYSLSSVNSESAWKAHALHVGVQLRLAL